MYLMTSSRENEGLYFEERPLPGKDLLNEMMCQQFEMQRDTYGIDYSQLTDEQKIAHFKEMKIAFDDEIHEALGEMGWKPWATSRHFNTEAVQGELVDAWHFFMNLMWISGMGPQVLFEKYQAKRLKNIARQQAAGGYDGVSTKCRGCKRALDDDAVKCHTTDVYEKTVNGKAVFKEAHCCHIVDPLGRLVP